MKESFEPTRCKTCEAPFYGAMPDKCPNCDGDPLAPLEHPRTEQLRRLVLKNENESEKKN